MGMTASEAKVLCRGPPPLHLRFPVGTRVETLDVADEHSIGASRRRAWSWSRGTVVRHWWQGNGKAAGEFASYQLQMDTDLKHLSFVRFDEDDNDIRAAVPSSPPRLVRCLREPTSLHDDYLVEKEAPVKGKRCAHCGNRNCCPKKARCRGCCIAVFCNTRCQTDGWNEHKGACKAAAAGDGATGAALLAEASSDVDPTHAQIMNSLHRIIRDADPRLGVSQYHILIQVALETGICIDMTSDNRIVNELTALLANAGWGSHHARTGYRYVGLGTDDRK